MLAISMSLAPVQAPTLAPVRHQALTAEPTPGGLPRRLTNEPQIGEDDFERQEPSALSDMGGAASDGIGGFWPYGECRL